MNEKISYYNQGNGYRANRLLKKAGVKIEWTPELRAEMKKCAADPIYFIENYMKVVHVDHGLVPFKLRDYQKEIVRSLHQNRYTIICTARQAGKSTVMIGYTLWYVLFNKTKTVALLANKGDTARELLGRLQLSYTYLPHWLQQGIDDNGGWNKGSIALENGSRILAGSTSADTIRGYTINLLILDEAAHVDNWEDFSTAVLPTITSGTTTKICQISTPYGLNHFWATWELATQGKNEYTPILVPWQKVPGRDEKWKQTTLASMNFDMDKFAQEFECITGETKIYLKDTKTDQILHLSISEAYDLINIQV